MALAKSLSHPRFQLNGHGDSLPNLLFAQNGRCRRPAAALNTGLGPNGRTGWGLTALNRLMNLILYYYIFKDSIDTSVVF